MSGLRVVAAACASLMLLGWGASAQTSLFSQTPMVGGGPAPAATAPAAAAAPDAAPAEARPRPKAKPRGPTPARTLTITNVTGSALTEFVVAADGKQAKLPRELGTNEKAVMKLPAFRSCVVTLIATFQRAGEAEQNEQDICKDRTVRLTN